MTIEDEALPKMGDRLPQALEVAKRISRYGGSVVVLIHPNVLDHKLAFEKGFVEGVRPYAWFGSVGNSGRWWAARNRVEVDVVRDAAAMRVTLNVPVSLAGLTLEVPPGWEVARSGNPLRGVAQHGTMVTFPQLQGTYTSSSPSSFEPVGFSHVVIAFEPSEHGPVVKERCARSCARRYEPDAEPSHSIEP